MRVSVVGASGFVGRGLAAHLQGLGHDVFGISRQATTGTSPLEWRRAPDLLDEGADWRIPLAGTDVVVLLAAMAHDTRSSATSHPYMGANGEAPIHIARAARSVGARRFIFVSTIKVLGDSTSPGERVSEVSPYRPVGPYAESKAFAERALQSEYHFEDGWLTIMRPPLVVGAKPKGNLRTIERAIEAGIPLPFGSRRMGHRSYIGLSSLHSVLGLLVTATCPPAIVHARNDEEPNVAELAGMIADSCGRPLRVFPVPPALMRMAAKPFGKGDWVDKFSSPMLVSDDASRLQLGWAPSVSLHDEMQNQSPSTSATTDGTPA